MKAISVFIIEEYVTRVKQEPLTLNLDDYPELRGKSPVEIGEYLKRNANSMKPVNANAYASLEEELLDQSIVWDKVTEATQEWHVTTSESEE